MDGSADPSQKKRCCHGANHIQQGSLAQNEQHYCADQKQVEAANGCAAPIFLMQPAKKQTVSQISENHKNLQGIVNQLPLRCGEKSFAGMIAQSKYGKLQEDIGAEKSRQSKTAADSA